MEFHQGVSGPAITAHGSLDPKQEIQIQSQTKELVRFSVVKILQQNQTLKLDTR
jgi:hypothetical protein